MNADKLKRYRENWVEEKNSAAIYEALSQKEDDKRIAEVYQRMAGAENRHAVKWAKLYQEEGGDSLPVFKPAWRTRSLIWLARRFGPEMVLPGMMAAEKNGSGSYLVQPEAAGMAREENSHQMILSQIRKTAGGGMQGSTLAQLEGRHRSSGGNALRAAVLGANDGLVSNLSLVMGVAGAAMSSQAILITGLAGMLAGAFSMALGEWLSVQSSRELYGHQISIEKEEIEQSPEEEAEELALIYEARGFDPQQASAMAHQVLSNQASALDVMAREELGVDPDVLGGSAWEAALTSFFLFLFGSIIPVIPYTFLTGTPAVIASIAFSTVGLFLLGTVITLFTGQKVIFSGMRMVVFGLIAAAITFGIGHLIGVSLGG
jgi:VIT1/CCC1 family predicted Fe2+/Mn2+ transporter